jgi:hypothetical protein
MAKKNEREGMHPDQVILNKIQQKRLAMLSGIDEKEISGRNIVQLTEELKWRIDPRIFRFKRICGRVVKKDPVTGIEYPVPFATVYVEDTDCNVITYHPPGHPWSWHFPYFCNREIIATTHTDACGNFCVWVPRFDIDWIRRWRRERICFPVIFKRPFIRDIISKFPWPPVPNPPDPGPLDELNKLSASVLDSIGGNHAEVLKREISRIKNSSLGMINQNSDNILDKRLFDNEMPPPLSADFQQALSGNMVASKGASAIEAIRSDIASKLGIDAGTKELEGFSHERFIGPFYRCIDIYVPVWQMVTDIPDITFRVTQDTNGDGVEETIYSEGHFDVRWDAGAISNVTLVASSIAKESRLCGVPLIPCGNAPDILFAGFMPLRNLSYFNDSTGYALRPNRPKPSGLPGGVSSFPASTPFCGVLQLYGCADLQNAKYYRIQQSTDNGTSYSAITGLSWNNYLLSLPIPITADSNGWYPVEPINPVTLNPVPRASLEFPNLLLDWPTPASEKSLLKIELGDNSKNHISESTAVAIVSDNTRPNISLTNLSWKYVGEPDASLRNLTGDCPMIQRGAVPQDIEVVFEVFVSAQHLRDASLGTSGCGGGSFFGIADAANKPAHWHQTVLDNSETLHQRYRLNAASKPGCYSFECTANSRSMNPSGADGGNLLPTPDWFYDPVYLYSLLVKSVAVVNENLS